MNEMFALVDRFGNAQSVLIGQQDHWRFTTLPGRMRLQEAEKVSSLIPGFDRSTSTQPQPAATIEASLHPWGPL
jgi:hypothetical protein